MDWERERQSPPQPLVPESAEDVWWGRLLMVAAARPSAPALQLLLEGQTTIPPECPDGGNCIIPILADFGP